MSREITTLVPWFGSARMLAEKVGQALKGRKWVGVCFAGGMCETRHIEAQTLLINDLHRHVINLARHVANPTELHDLICRLERTPFHPDVLLEAQRHCQETVETASVREDAYQYFLASWLGRSARAGTDSEFTGGLSTRWTVSGGASGIRFRAAVRGLRSFGLTLRKAEFSTLDVFEFLDNIKDEETHAIYSDAPFPGAGDAYRNKFTPQMHQQLAAKLGSFKKTRVVVRYSDHELIRPLYPDKLWACEEHDTRNQANQLRGEVLLVNRCTL